MAEEAAPTTPASPPNGSAEPARRMPDGHPPPVVKPPSPRRSTEPYMGIEVSSPFESDRSLPGRLASDFVTAARDCWALACSTHVAFMAEVNALKTEPAQALKSRDAFYKTKQAALKLADQALGAVPGRDPGDRGEGRAEDAAAATW